MIDLKELENTTVPGAVKKALKEIDNNVNGLSVNAVLTPKLTQNYLTVFGNSILNAKYNYGTWFCAESKGEFLFYKNAAVGGNTTSDMLLRLDDIPLESDAVIVMEATNDAATGVTVTEHTARIKLILEHIINVVKARPIFILSPPNNEIARTILVDEMNQNDLKLCRAMGVMCFNPWESFAKPDGTFLDGITVVSDVNPDGDGTHPNSAVHISVGSILNEMYKRKEYAVLSPRINDQGIIPNSLLMLDNGSNTDVPSTFWRAGHTSAQLIETDLGKGRTWNVNFSNEDGSITSTQYPLTPNTPYMFVCNFNATFNSGESVLRLVLEPDEGNFKYVFDDVITSVGDSKLAIFFTIDDSQTSVRLKFSVESGVFDVDVNLAEIQIYDLSVL